MPALPISTLNHYIKENISQIQLKSNSLTGLYDFYRQKISSRTSFERLIRTYNLDMYKRDLINEMSGKVKLKRITTKRNEAIIKSRLRKQHSI